MASLEERYQAGLETRRKFGGGTVGSGSVPGSNEMAPDLHRIAAEALFGSIWPRPGLATEHREMSTLSVLCVLQRENQLRQHIANALNLGLTPQQVIEVFIHVSYYGGVPTAFNAMGIAKEVFENKGVDFEPLLVHNPSDSPDDLYNRGVELREKYMGASYGGGRPEPVTQAERDFLRLTGEYYWGSVWTRPGIDLEARCICTLSALTALGREGPLESHIRAGLNIGFTPERIMEVFIHTAYYAGLPFVRAAMDVANRVFASR